MKILLAKLRDRKGSAMAFGILLFIVMLVLFSTLFIYSELKITTANLKNTAQCVLDTCTATEGQNAVESIKNGTDYLPALSKDLFTERLQSALGIGDDMVGYQNGKEKFQISDISFLCTKTKEIKTSASFQLREPLYFLGKEVTALHLTVTLHSQYLAK